MMKSGPKARRTAKAAVRRPVSSQAGGVDGFDARSWAGIPAAFRSSGALFSPWTEIFAPLREGTVDDLMVWLTQQSEAYAYAFEKPKVIRAAIDHAHVKSDTAIAGAREIAFFPPMTGG